jgi:hypothetical protein
MTRRPVTAGSQWRKKKSRLPNNFDRLLADEDLENLQAIFDTREVKTRGGPGRQAVLSLATCPGDDFTRRLVEQGVDVADADGTRRPPSSC